MEENGICEPIKKETVVHHPIVNQRKVEENRRISYVNSDAGQCQRACSVYVHVNTKQQQHLLEKKQQYSQAVYKEGDEPTGTTTPKQ